MEYFRIKNWEKYQLPAKKRGIVLPWIRLDTALLDDPKTYNMTALNFAIWVKLLLIARRFDNQVALDLRWIAHNMRFRARNWRKNIAYFEDLGLIEVFSAPGLTDKTDGLTAREETSHVGRSRGPLEGPNAPPKTINELVADTNKKLGIVR